MKEDKILENCKQRVFACVGSIQCTCKVGNFLAHILISALIFFSMSKSSLTVVVAEHHLERDESEVEHTLSRVTPVS